MTEPYVYRPSCPSFKLTILPSRHWTSARWWKVRTDGGYARFGLSTVYELPITAEDLELLDTEEALVRCLEAMIAAIRKGY